MELRKGGIGSSDVGTILGLNPYQTPYQLWRQKKGLDTPPEETMAMRLGHYLEDAVATCYHDATGRAIIKASVGDWIIASNSHPHMRVSPDRTAWWFPDAPKKHENKGIVECKTTQMQIDGDNLPQHWFCQLQYQLGVAELNYGALAWLTMGREFGYRDITFDKDFFGWIAEEVTRFWVDNIIGNKEPIAINVDDVLLKAPQHIVGKTLDADDKLIERCAELKELREHLSAMELRRRDIEAEIKMAMGDAEALVIPGTTQPLCTWKTGKDRVKFDDKKLAKDMPETYAKYSYTTSGSRTFNLK